MDMNKIDEKPAGIFASNQHLLENMGQSNANPKSISFLELIREDFGIYQNDFFSQGFWALHWHRFGNWRMDLPKAIRPFATIVYRIMYKCTQWLCGIDLPYNVVVGRRLKLEHFGGMILVPNSIGDDVTIRQNVTLGIAKLSDLSGRPSIGNGVEIGAGAVVIGDILVGNNCTIGANSVVTKSIPSGMTVIGAPAKELNLRAL